MKVTILKKDFDAAVRFGVWHSSTCILAQTATRLGIDHNSTIAFADKSAMKLRTEFDACWDKGLNPQPPDKLALAAVRKQLPMTVIVPDETLT